MSVFATSFREKKGRICLHWQGNREGKSHKFLLKLLKPPHVFAKAVPLPSLFFMQLSGRDAPIYFFGGGMGGRGGCLKDFFFLETDLETASLLVGYAVHICVKCGLERITLS